MILLKHIFQATFFRYSLLIIAIIFTLTVKSVGQDNAPVKFGKVKVEDFTVHSAAIDSSSNAVIIYDKGDITFEGNKTGWFSYIFKRSRRILLINKKGFDLATVELLLYKNDDTKEKVEELTGITYNIENGKVVEARLQDKDVFEEKYDKSHFYKKFAMPGVKEGSIIEYSYTVKSDFTFNLPSWEFQSTKSPTLWSEYNVVIPGLLSYMSIFQGSHKFDIDKSGEGFKSYSINQVTHGGGAYGINTEERVSVSAPTTLHRWVMKNIPKFYAENYISSPANFIDKMSFQLYQTYDGEKFHDVANNWQKVTEELMKQEDFGKPLNEESYWLDKLLAQVVQDNDDALQKAEKIYYYIQNNYNCTNHYDKYIKTSLQDVVKKKSGTVGDINLLLIAMLKYENINALPVLLSTSEYGRNSPTYPLLERLNYVVGKININSTDYYLDATIPFLPFGKLPLNCYNGHARVISKDTSAVYFETDLIKETSTVNVFIANNVSNEMGGVFTRKMGFFESLEAKTTIAKLSLNTYQENLIKNYPEDMSVSNIKVDSLQSPEASVSVKFDFKPGSFENNDIVYFNPMIGEALIKNPFYAANRIYPVEMPYTTDETYTLHMEIPKGYKVEELPKSVRSVFNESEGSFEYIISADADILQLKCRLVLNKTYFAPEDYQVLRDFYASVVKKQAEQIVFKKIK